MKAVTLSNGIMHLAESKAACPHCTRCIPFEEAEAGISKSANGFGKLKCKCKRTIGVTSDIQGDLVAYEIQKR